MEEVKTIARYHGQLPTKFGVPRQSGVVSTLQGKIVFEPEYRSVDALRGIDSFDYLWVIWEFSANKPQKDDSTFRATVRPPRLGGNHRMGVFATRSPYHPNSIGLSSVKLERVEWDSKDGPVLYVSGADLMDGTPILDVKPYVEYADSHVGVRSGFVDKNSWKPLMVEYDDIVVSQLAKDELKTLVSLLEQDPRPHYHKDPMRVYGMPYANWDVRFRVEEGILKILEIRFLRHR